MCPEVWAETIRLKSGVVLEGKITQHSNQAITIDRGVGFSASYYLDEIDSIDEATTSNPPALALEAPVEVKDAANFSAEITFRFAPPDGIHFTQEAVEATGMYIDGRPSQNTSSMRVKRGIDIRKTPTGYSVVETTLEVRAFENNIELDPNSPGISVLKGVIINYELDPSGYVLSATGGDEFMGKLKEILPSAFEAQGQQKQGPQPLWADHIGRFFGRTFKVGDVWEETEKVPSPFGEELVYSVKVEFAAKVQCAREPQSCVFITVTKELKNPDAFNVVMDKGREAGEAFRLKNSKKQGALAYMGEKIQQAKTAAFQSKLVGQSIKQTLVIDPATMLIYGDDQTRISNLEIITSEGTHKAEQKEQVQYILDYARR